MNLVSTVLFTYNRPWHTKQTVEALQKNMYAEQSQLFIFSDGPKTEKDESKVKEVRKYLKTIKGFKNIEIIERDKNWELVNNIIDAVTKIVNKHGRIIVLWTPWKRARKYHKKISEKTQIYIDLTKE